MSDDENVKNYIESLQNQIVEILNKVKEETGVDTPVEIEVRSADNE